MKTEMKDDLAKILHRIIDGDDSAFDQLFMKMYPAIKHFLVTLLRSDHIGEEIAQDVFTTLWLTRDRIDPNGNFQGYLYRIARNKAFNYIRQSKSDIIRPIDYDLDIASSESTDAEMLAKETELLIELVVSRMPPQRQRVYLMSRKEGVPNSLIAEELGITKNAVERHITFAMKDIRAVLKIFMYLFAGLG